METSPPSSTQKTAMELNPWEPRIRTAAASGANRPIPASIPGTRVKKTGLPESAWRVGEVSPVTGNPGSGESSKKKKNRGEERSRAPSENPGRRRLWGRIGRRSKFFFSLSSPRHRVSAVYFFHEKASSVKADVAAPGTPFQPRGEPTRKPPKKPFCTQNPEPQKKLDLVPWYRPYKGERRRT